MPTHAIVTDDPRLNYMVVPQPDINEPEPEHPVIASNEVMTPIDKYDFYIPLTEEDKENTKHTEPLPASFLQIKEGDVQAGIDWYKKHYPKVPDELVEIMARYNFGDLKYATRKSIRNDAKKFKKKHKKPQLLTQGFTVKSGPHIVTFD